MKWPDLENYSFEKALGHGGFGTSYLAIHQHSGQSCVIKKLAMERLQDWKSIELFQREAQTLKQLRHPRIPRYLDFIETQAGDQSQFYLVQSYAEGQSLASWVEQGKRFTEAEVVDLGCQISEILVYLQAHHPPFIHRDIKPENLILNEGQVSLIDFGSVSKFAAGERGSTMVGSLGYMAPEQFHGQAYPATDVYGLGATLIYLLTHRHPSELSTGGFKLKFRHLLQCSRGLAEVLDKMVRPHHNDRYTRAQDLSAEFERLKAGKLPEVLASEIATTLTTRTPSLATAGDSRLKILILGGFLGFALLSAMLFSVRRTADHMNAERNNAIRQKIENAYEEAYRAEYGEPNRPVQLPE